MNKLVFVVDCVNQMHNNNDMQCQFTVKLKPKHFQFQIAHIIRVIAMLQHH